MDGEKWLEWAEISRRVLENLDYQDQQVLHVRVPNKPLTSIVVHPCPISDRVNEQRVRVHPVLFDFLSYSRTQVADVGNSVSNTQPIALDCLPWSFQHFNQIEVEGTKSLDWSVSLLSLVELPQNTTVTFDVIFCDDSFARHLQKIPAHLREITFKTLMLGRIVRHDSILLLSTNMGYTIGVTKFVSGEEKDEAYRIPADPDEYELTLELADETLDELSRATKMEDDKLESTVPGYEDFLQKIIQLANLGRTKVSPSAVLLTGCQGVGKSRLSSVFAKTWASTHASEGRRVSILQVDELFVNAVAETNLFENFIAPSLRDCEVCIIDNLQLLERESSEELLQQDIEFTSVLNSLVQAIDDYQHSCFILGVTREASRLPHSLTKVGRFEKEIEMLSPSQAQREEIWQSLLEETVRDTGVREAWASQLADVTAGCVASDLVQILDSAWISLSASNNTDGEEEAEMTWEYLSEAARKAVPSQLKELDVRKPLMFDSNLTWREIHERSWEAFCGYETMKRDIFRQVVVPWRQFLQQLEASSETDRLQIAPPPGVLFHGPSGCGKTYAVPCLASSLQLSIIQVRATDLLDKWLGGSEAILRKLFSRARAAAPCVLFIDEIDAIANNRQTDDSNDLSSRILSTFLNEMDGVSSGAHSNKVLVIACTNRLDALDAALLRPGRLQEHFALTAPDQKDLLDMVQYYLRKVPLHDDVKQDDIANLLFEKGRGAAHVEGFCRDAVLEALHRIDDDKIDELVVEWKDFQVVLDRTRRSTNDD